MGGNALNWLSSVFPLPESILYERGGSPVGPHLTLSYPIGPYRLPDRLLNGLDPVGYLKSLGQSPLLSLFASPTERMYTKW